MWDRQGLLFLIYKQDLRIFQSTAEGYSQEFCIYFKEKKHHPTN